MTAPSTPLPQILDPELPSHLAPGPAGNGRTLGAVNEMLERLDTVTDAGRQHLMSKIVAVLSAHPLASADPCVRAQVADLRREAGKPAPDGASFAGVARPLLAALIWAP